MRGFRQTGIASWYGGKFHGRTTASGEVYNKNKMTAAHRTLPFHTRIRVRNLQNGRSVVLKVNDRGPFVKGRIVDCSRAAARKLGFETAGTARVEITVTDAPADRSPGGRHDRAHPAGPVAHGAWVVQVGAFHEHARAEAMERRLRSWYSAVYIRKFRDLFRVRVGPLTTESEAREAARQLQRQGIDGFVTRED